jgi:Ner family transcriptional regulator
MNAKKRQVRAAKIKLRLIERGLTCTELERRHGLPAGACTNALYEPGTAGENAIAEALGVPPQEIWSERFDADGVRHTPQPPVNYRMRGSGESRRKARAS